MPFCQRYVILPIRARCTWWQRSPRQRGVIWGAWEMSVTATGVRCRRQRVTVLFVDIVGFTAMVDDLDCADVHALQTDYFALVSAAVRECGGVVEKFVGDAVMAVFGVRTGVREG